jgi:hypothetical protein
MEKIPLVERWKVVERDPACCENCPLEAPQRRRSHSLVGGELRETNPCFFVWFDSLSCFSSILHLLPLRSTWVCYLCVQGSLSCLWSSTKATHQVRFVQEFKRCLKSLLQVFYATPVWPVRRTGLTGVTCEVQCLTGRTGHHHRSDRWSTVSSSIWGRKSLIWSSRLFTPPLGDIKVLSDRWASRFLGTVFTWLLAPVRLLPLRRQQTNERYFLYVDYERTTNLSTAGLHCDHLPASTVYDYTNWGHSQWVITENRVTPSPNLPQGTLSNQCSCLLVVYSWILLCLIVV